MASASGNAAVGNPALHGGVEDVQGNALQMPTGMMDNYYGAGVSDGLEGLAGKFNTKPNKDLEGGAAGAKEGPSPMDKPSNAALAGMNAESQGFNPSAGAGAGHLDGTNLPKLSEAQQLHNAMYSQQQQQQ